MRASIRLCLLLVMLGAWGSTAGAAYPDRAIRIVVPFPPDGPVDLVARIVGPKLGERLGQKVDIDHVAGDDGIIGSDLVAKAAPDGYTLQTGLNASMAVNPSLFAHLPYDPIADFAPVGMLAEFPFAIVVSKNFPAQSVKELIAMAKAKPPEVCVTLRSGRLGTAPVWGRSALQTGHQPAHADTCSPHFGQ